MDKTKARSELQRILIEKNLSQSGLAEATGLTPAGISLICLRQQEPKVSLAIKIAEAVGESVETLFSDFVSA